MVLQKKVKKQASTTQQNMFEKYSAYLTEFCSVNRTMETSTSENWDLTGTLGDLEALTALG